MISARIIKIIASCVASLGIIGGGYFINGNTNKVDNSTVIESNEANVAQEASPSEDNSNGTEVKSNNINDVINSIIDSNSNNAETSSNITSENDSKPQTNKEATEIQKSTETQKEETISKETNNESNKIENIIKNYTNNNNNVQISQGGNKTNESTTSTETQKEISSEGTTDSSAYIAEIEQLIFQKVNQERTAAGLAALSYNNTMEHYARFKSQDMGDRGYFDHANPEGQYITAKMKADGVSYMAWGENIAYISGMSGNSTLADKFMTNWMNSSGHRANILSTNFTSIGVGVYKIGNTYYATQEFYK